MLSLLLLAAAAEAADLKPAGRVTVAAVAEVPLYAGIAADDPYWYVEAKIGEQPLLLRLSTEVHGLRLTAAAASRAGLKVSGGEGARTAAVSGLQVGSATIDGAKAAIEPVSSFGYGTDGELGIASFPELAWAVEPSRGTVKVGPSGPGSVAEALGAGTPFTQEAASEPRVGKGKVKVPAATLIVPVRVSGVEIPATLSTGAAESRVFREADGADWFAVKGKPNPVYALPAVEGTWKGEKEREWREVAVGGVPAFTVVERPGAGFAYPFRPAARVGQDVVARGSLGIDAGRRLVALVPSAASRPAPYADVLGARLKTAAEASPPEGQDADAAKAALAGKLGPWIEYLFATGRTAEAVEPARRVAEATPEKCDGWHTLGVAQLASGDAAGAVPSLTRAGELYAAWAVLPLAERTERAATEARRSKAADFDGLWSQPHSCHTAWGNLAEAQLVAGNPAAVGALYPKHRDLDAGLPLAAGSALLRLGDTAGAESAFRQATQLSLLGLGAARGGMMLATRARAPELALAQYDAAPAAAREGLRFLHTWADLLRAGGAEAAIAGLKGHVARDPGSVPGWLTLAREQAAAGQDAGPSLAAAEKLLAAQALVTPRASLVLAHRAELLRLSGKLPEATAEAEAATRADASAGVGWYVASLVSESAGEAARAAEQRVRAASAGVADPLYASLVAGS
jgi:tetratricopeptide (TPR) repeat protein